MANRTSSRPRSRAAPRRPPIGVALQRWRKLRGLSQMALALAADVSARHLCFVENGRARPSRELVLILARALGLPLRERNQLLEAAGFAAEFRESGFDVLGVPSVRRAIDLLLARQEPFPAIVLDRAWSLMRRNDGAAALFGWLRGAPPGAPPPEPGTVNVLRAIFDPGALRPFVRDWERVAAALLARVRAEAPGGVLDARTEALLDELLAFPGVPRDLEDRLTGDPPHPIVPIVPIVPVTFAKDGLELSFFSALTTLGTPRDVTLQELRIEHFFPADEATERAVLGGAPARR